MRLVTFLAGDRPGPGCGVHLGDHVLELDGEGEPVAGAAGNLQALLAAGPSALARARRAAERTLAALRRRDDAPLSQGLHASTAIQLLAPLPRPPKVIAIGRNYRDHVREARVKQPDMPKLFAKFPNTVVGPGAAIVRPSATDAVDYEAELAVVIGQPARAVAPRDALRHVAGYTVANDVSARDIQYHDEQLTLAKNFRTFLPLGPWLVTADEVPQPGALDIRCWLNDRLMQDANTSDLVFDIPYLIAFVSAVTDLDPGDVILTGTPAGVGYARTPPVFLQPGDRVRVEVAGVGVLENRVVAEDPPRPLPTAPRS